MKSKQEFKKSFVKRSFSECAELIKDHFTPSKETSLLYIGLEHIEQGTLRISSIGKSSDVISQKLKFKKNDILFGKLRPYFRKVVRPNFDGVCSTDIFVVRAKEGFSQTFLYYLMASQEFVNYSSRGSQGTKMPRASWDFLEKYEQGIPSLEEQEGIGKTLDDLDTKIENLRNQNKVLEQTARAIFQSWFVDFDSQTEFENSELGQIPKGWKVKKLIDKISVTYGFPFKSKLFNSEKGVPVIRIRNISDNFSDNLTTEVCDKKFHIFAGDIITGMDGEFNTSVWLGEESLLNQRVCKLFSKNKILSNLLILFQVEQKLKEYEDKILGTTVIHLSKPDIEEIKIIFPNDEILKKYNKFSESLLQKLIKNQKSIFLLRKIRETLLPKLMSGEIRV